MTSPYSFMYMGHKRMKVFLNTFIKVYVSTSRIPINLLNASHVYHASLVRHPSFCIPPCPMVQQSAHKLPHGGSPDAITPPTEPRKLAFEFLLISC